MGRSAGIAVGVSQETDPPAGDTTAVTVRLPDARLARPVRTEAGRGRPRDGGSRIPSATDGTDSPGRDATLPI